MPKERKPGATNSLLTEHAASIVVLHLVSGALFIGLIEGWNPTDALYFCITTLTTVGYGDIAPKSVMGRLFTSVHILLGCLISASCLGTLIARMQSSMREAGGKAAARSVTSDLTRALSISGMIILSGTVYGSMVEGWKLNDAFYWAVVSCTSVGLGDLTPAPFFRPLAGVYLLMSVGAFASAAAQVARACAAIETERQIAAFVSRGVSAELIESIDTDGDGQVTRLEFIKHMLLARGLVEDTELAKVEALFDSLDVDGSGTLDAADIVGAVKPETPRSTFAMRSLSRDEASEGSEIADEGAAMLPQWRGARGGAAVP